MFSCHDKHRCSESASVRPAGVRNFKNARTDRPAGVRDLNCARALTCAQVRVLCRCYAPRSECTEAPSLGAQRGQN
eukprot:13677231-Alexandrium_andersonii.AAC.1